LKQRESAKVQEVFYGKEDHGILTCSLMLGSEGNSMQGFGNLALDEETGPAFVSSICELFKVNKLGKIKGKSCFALRCWPDWNTSIEGIEVDGSRFLLTQFRRKFWPNDTKTVLKTKKESILKEIAWAKRRVTELEMEMAQVTNGYIDWETEK